MSPEKQGSGTPETHSLRERYTLLCQCHWIILDTLSWVAGRESSVAEPGENLPAPSPQRGPAGHLELAWEISLKVTR